MAFVWEGLISGGEKVGYLVDDFRLTLELWKRIGEHLVLAAAETESEESKREYLLLIMWHEKITKAIEELQAEALALLGPQHT